MISTATLHARIHWSAAVAVALLALMVTAVRRRILRARRRPRQQGDRKIWPKRWGKSANCPRTLRSSGC